MSDKSGNKSSESNTLIWDRNIVALEYKKGVHQATVTVKSGSVLLYTKGKGKEENLFSWKVK